jgi:hypothetical protein
MHGSIYIKKLYYYARIHKHKTKILLESIHERILSNPRIHEHKAYKKWQKFIVLLKLTCKSNFLITLPVRQVRIICFNLAVCFNEWSIIHTCIGQCAHCVPRCYDLVALQPIFWNVTTQTCYNLRLSSVETDPDNKNSTEPLRSSFVTWHYAVVGQHKKQVAAVMNTCLNIQENMSLNVIPVCALTNNR